MVFQFFVTLVCFKSILNGVRLIIGIFVKTFAMRTKYLLWIAFAILIFGCNSSKNSDSSITIATLKGPSSMGMIKLIDSLKSSSSSTIEVMILNEPIQVRKMMLDGSADFAVLPTTMAAILYNKGLNYNLVGIPVWGTLSLMGTDSTIAQWSQLKGKRIHVMAKGMTPDVMFRYLLSKNGVNPDTDVTIDYSFPTHIDLANAVAAGKADLAVLSEPMASQVLQKRSDVRLIFDFNDEWHRQQGSQIALTAFLVSTNLAKNNSNLVNQIATGYEQSSVWVNQNPDSAADLMVKYEVLPNREVALQAIPRSNLKFVRAREIKKQIDDYLNVFYQMNPDIVGGKMPDEEFIY